MYLVFFFRTSKNICFKKQILLFKGTISRAAETKCLSDKKSHVMTLICCSYSSGYNFVVGTSSTTKHCFLKAVMH